MSIKLFGKILIIIRLRLGLLSTCFLLSIHGVILYLFMEIILLILLELFNLFYLFYDNFTYTLFEKKIKIWADVWV